MQIIYRLIMWLLGVVGAAAALAINIIYSTSTRFQSLVGMHPDASHGWLGLGCAILAFIGACLLLFKFSIPAGVVLLVIAGIGFFFVVGAWALLASPQMLIAAFFGAYYYVDAKHDEALRQAAQQGRLQQPERPPSEGGIPAAG
jgi:hypothetical protein